MNQVATMKDSPHHKSVTVAMANRYEMEPVAFEATLRATVVPKDCTREQFAAFLMVAKEYSLNPLTKEIYAFPTRGGGIQPIISIDGWMNIINSHPQFDGMELVPEHDDKGKLTAVTCRMHRKDRNHPTTITEYMGECYRNTDTWKQWPARMLRHKAAIQCARYAFGFSGIMDEDEVDRMRDVTPVPAAPPAPKLEAAPPSAPKFQSGTRQSGSTRTGERQSKGDLALSASMRFADPAHQAAFDAQAPLEPHDDETGEVIDADAGEPIDVPAWLDELETLMAAARSRSDLNEAWADYGHPNKGRVTPEQWRDAEKVYERHDTRLAG